MVSGNVRMIVAVMDTMQMVCSKTESLIYLYGISQCHRVYQHKMVSTPHPVSSAMVQIPITFFSIRM